MASCLRTVSKKRQSVSHFVISKKHVGLRNPWKPLSSGEPLTISQCRFVRFLMTRATSSPSSCCKKKIHSCCMSAFFKRYSTLSMEASNLRESFTCCTQKRHEDPQACYMQVDDAEKLSYLLLDRYSPVGNCFNGPSSLILTVKSREAMSDDIILWDTKGINRAVLKFERIEKDGLAFLSDVEKNMLLFVDKNATNSPKAALESSGKPSEEQLLRVKEALADSLPKLFIKQLEYSLYHQNIVFENNLIGKRTVGLPEYMKQMSLLKIVGHFKFAYIRLELLKISMHPEDSSIKVRWRIRGISGLKVFITFWKFKLWNIKDIYEKQDAWYDGFSSFYVGQDGLIHKHIADKMMPDSDRVAVGEQKTDIATKLALFAGFVVRPSLSEMFPLLTLSNESKSSSHLSDMVFPMHRLE